MFILNGNSYEGYVKVKNRRYFVHAYLPNYPSLKGINLNVDWRLRMLLNENLESFTEFHKWNNFNDFIASFEKLTHEKLSDEKQDNSWLQNPLKTYGFYKRLEEEINQVGKYIKSIDVENGFLEVEVTDVALRTHNATLKISYNYPKEPIKIISYDLPIHENFSNHRFMDLQLITSVTAFCKVFSQCVDAFQNFWNVAALIDSNCWVLDPENPKFKDITRRIKISDSLSIVLTFDPYSPNHRPNIQFLGCQSNVDHFREIIHKNLEEDLWDPELDIIYNLETLLEVSLPTKTECENSISTDLIQPGECAICFTLRLENEIPTQICDNPSCMSNYHAICLFKYLRSVSSNKDCFGKIQGKCPNCDEVISCPVPNFV